MKIEKNDMVMVYDGGGTVPHCKYTGRFGDLTAYWQEIVSDAVYLFRLGESEECDWLVLLGQPWSPYSPDGIPIFRKRLPSRTWDGAGGHGEPEAVGTRYPFRHGSSAHKNRFREAMRMDDCGSEKTIHYEEEGTQDGAKA